MGMGRLLKQVAPAHTAGDAGLKYLYRWAGLESATIAHMQATGMVGGM